MTRINFDTPPRVTADPTRRLLHFAGTGLAIGLGWLLWVSAGYVVTGGDNLSRYGVTYLQVALVYVVGGTVAGVLVSICYPLGRWILGAAVVGTLAFLPLYFGFMLTERTGDGWAVDTTLALIPSVLLGGVAGVGLWFDHHKDHAPRWVRALRFPTVRLMVGLWTFAVICSIFGWSFLLRWPGELLRAGIGLALFVIPTALAMIVTVLSWHNIGKRQANLHR